MPREGLTQGALVAVATRLVDSEGPAALSLVRVAGELGVRPPSLYSHVNGLAALERLVALDGIERLTGACRAALVGNAGADGLRALGRAYRSFALAHPGAYALAQVARPGDAEYEAAAAPLLDALFIVLSTCGVPEQDLVHAARSVRSALHGFTMLEAQSGFGLDADVNESFHWLLGAIERCLTVG